MPSTTRYKRGEIVLVPFPFTDLSSSKRRPALIISPDAFNDQRQDVVVAAITSQLTNEHAITIEPSDCVDGILPKTSVVKLAKLFTIHSTLVIKILCALREEKLAAVLVELRPVLLIAARLRLTPSLAEVDADSPWSYPAVISLVLVEHSLRLRLSHAERASVEPASASIERTGSSVR